MTAVQNNTPTTQQPPPPSSSAGDPKNAQSATVKAAQSQTAAVQAALDSAANAQDAGIKGRKLFGFEVPETIPFGEIGAYTEHGGIVGVQEEGAAATEGNAVGTAEASGATNVNTAAAANFDRDFAFGEIVNPLSSSRQRSAPTIAGQQALVNGIVDARDPGVDFTSSIGPITTEAKGALSDGGTQVEADFHDGSGVKENYDVSHIPAGQSIKIPGTSEIYKSTVNGQTLYTVSNEAESQAYVSKGKPTINSDGTLSFGDDAVLAKGAGPGETDSGAAQVAAKTVLDGTTAKNAALNQALQYSAQGIANTNAALTEQANFTAAGKSKINQSIVDFQNALQDPSATPADVSAAAKSFQNTVNRTVTGGVDVTGGKINGAMATLIRSSKALADSFSGKATGTNAVATSAADYLDKLGNGLPRSGGGPLPPDQAAALMTATGTIPAPKTIGIQNPDGTTTQVAVQVGPGAVIPSAAAEAADIKAALAQSVVKIPTLPASAGAAAVGTA